MTVQSLLPETMNAPRAVGRERHRGHGARVSREGPHTRARGQVPDLDGLVEAPGHDVRAVGGHCPDTLRVAEEGPDQTLVADDVLVFAVAGAVAVAPMAVAAAVGFAHRRVAREVRCEAVGAEAEVAGAVEAQGWSERRETRSRGTATELPVESRARPYPLARTRNSLGVCSGWDVGGTLGIGVCGQTLLTLLCG